eukprot:scaffold16929_cov108-Skeletonema_dohrnii-CCMP3373.AAC.1
MRRAKIMKVRLRAQDNKTTLLANQPSLLQVLLQHQTLSKAQKRLPEQLLRISSGILGRPRTHFCSLHCLRWHQNSVT